MTGEDVEVAVKRLDINAHVGDGLSAIDKDACSISVRHLDHLLRRGYGTESV